MGTFSSTLRDGDKDHFIPYNFKGFSTEQRQKFLDEQSNQIQAKENEAEDQKQKEDEFSAQQQYYGRTSLLQLRNAQRFKAEQKMKLAQMHKARIEEAKIKKDETNKAYQNAATPAYFRQFQTSTR